MTANPFFAAVGAFAAAAAAAPWKFGLSGEGVNTFWELRMKREPLVGKWDLAWEREKRL